MVKALDFKYPFLYQVTMVLTISSEALIGEQLYLALRRTRDVILLPTFPPTSSLTVNHPFVCPCAFSSLLQPPQHWHHNLLSSLISPNDLHNIPPDMLFWHSNHMTIYRGEDANGVYDVTYTSRSSRFLPTKIYSLAQTPTAITGGPETRYANPKNSLEGLCIMYICIRLYAIISINSMLMR